MSDMPHVDFMTSLFPSEIGNTIVFAPHPDDESLGCGGTIYLLSQSGFKVNVVFLSDGTMSHPASKKYPAESLMLLREQEAVNALSILGVAEKQTTFLRLKDSMVPFKDEIGFEHAVDLIAKKINELAPKTIFVPWKRDPHKDHQASWQIIESAINRKEYPVRVLQYFVWFWERAAPADFPQEREVEWCKVDIKSIMNIKQQAIAAHVSQVTSLIDDDPNGFILSPEVLNHFNTKYEIFVETNNTIL